MTIEEIKINAFGMPFSCPSTIKMDYKFKKREYFTVSYETDVAVLQSLVPEPLKVVSNIVKFEFMAMPDAYGFGSFHEAGQLIEVEFFEGEKGFYSHSMYVSDLAPIAAGREIWGYPKKYGQPTLMVDVDTLVGTLKYNNINVAIGTMGYKYQELSLAETRDVLEKKPTFLLKIIPDADGKRAAICQLVRCFLIDVIVHEAYSGPAALQLLEHALAPVTQLPVRKILGANHIIADVTLGFGEVVYDYLAK